LKHLETAFQASDRRRYAHGRCLSRAAGLSARSVWGNCPFRTVEPIIPR